MTSVVLMAMGMTYLMLADTENKIALAERDGRQVLYAALTGATMVEGWFNVPDPAFNPFVPHRTQCDLTQRVGDSDYNGTDDIDVSVNGIIQAYRGGAATGTYQLFDKPFRGHVRDTFWGRRDTPDLLITNDPEQDNDFLDRVGWVFNSDDSPSLEGVEIAEIRIYAPPFDVALQTRYGVCTVEVTARKVRTAGTSRRILAQRTVKTVLQELPFPAPGAAIESSGNVDLSGNFGVHWGGTYTETDTALQSGSNFPGPGLPREDTSRWQFEDFSPAAPDLDLATSGIQNLLEQLLDDGSGDPFEMEDPWVHFRSVGSILEAPNIDDQPWPYDYTVGLEDDRSIFFQNQNYSFPALQYNFWKKFCQTRARHASYYKFAGMDGDEPLYRKNGFGTSYTFAHWVNTENPGVEAGIYFFDTANSSNPQNGGAGVLVPDLKLNSGTIDSDSGYFLMEGLIYTNAARVDSSGIAGHAVTKAVNMPGEPFLDTGIDINRNGVIGDTLEELDTIDNNVWDFLLPGSTLSDGPLYDELYGTFDFTSFEATHQFVDGEYPHGHADPALLVDVLHEPFLNLAYPEPDQVDDPLYVDFDFETTDSREIGGDRDEDGTTDVMTSLRERRGALVELDIVLDGIWYNEGEYNGSGNLPVYGSILMRQGFTATGSPDVYFNEGLVLGDFPPAEMQIPRVYTSHVTSN